TVHASPDSAYWRATTLDAFRNDGWDEDRFPVSQAGLTTDPLLPAAAADRRNWTRADFTIDALRDVHLVSTSQPVAYDTQSLQNVQYWRGGIAITQSPVSRGDTYTAWGYEPQPKPAQLAKSPPDYPPEIRLDGRYLRLEHSNAVPPFGTPQHETWARAYFNVNRDGRRYRPLYLVAKRIAGKARNPYAAAIALEAWFRSAG